MPEPREHQANNVLEVSWTIDGPQPCILMVRFLAANCIDASNACQFREPGNNVLVRHRDLYSWSSLTYETAFSFKYSSEPGCVYRSYIARCHRRAISAPHAFGRAEVHWAAAKWAWNVLIPVCVAGDAVPRSVRAAARRSATRAHFQWHVVQRQDAFLLRRS